MAGRQPRTAASVIDRLVDRVDAVGAPLCVGLDPVLERLPDELVPRENIDPATAISRFDEGVIDAVSGVAAAVKFQSACYERHGAAGVDVLARSIERANESGLITILDAKRGDIGISAKHYAHAARHALGADAITLNAYLGPSSVEPFLEAGLAVFALVRTSNPDSDTVQAQPLARGGSVADLLASVVRSVGAGHIGSSGLSACGAVVGATKASLEETAGLRERMPDQVFLVPGIGAQGGRVSDLACMLRTNNAIAASPGTSGVLVTASRSVIYAFDTEAANAQPSSIDAAETEKKPRSWTDAVRNAALELAAELRHLKAHDDG
ncbi:MAG: orotidine-5'-phosphate decarboxylase [Planctomycetota bacterium]